MFLKRFGPYFSYLKPVRKQFALGLGFGLTSLYDKQAKTALSTNSEPTEA